VGGIAAHPEKCFDKGIEHHLIGSVVQSRDRKGIVGVVPEGKKPVGEAAEQDKKEDYLSLPVSRGKSFHEQIPQ
jgi:hypothetical protein